MDTVLGVVDLTKNQAMRIGEINSAPFHGFVYNHTTKELVGVSSSEPTQEQKTSALNSAISLPDSKSQKIIESEFNSIVMRKRLFEILPTLSSFNLRLEIGAYEAFAESRNFLGMKQYTNLLVANGVATSADRDKIFSVVAEQGVDMAGF